MRVRVRVSVGREVIRVIRAIRSIRTVRNYTYMD